MARFKSRKSTTRSTRRSSGRRFTPRRRAPNRTRKSAAKPQTVRIVIEQPQPQPAGIPGMLPEQVGAVIATSPRRARF